MTDKTELELMIDAHIDEKVTERLHGAENKSRDILVTVLQTLKSQYLKEKSAHEYFKNENLTSCAIETEGARRTLLCLIDDLNSWCLGNEFHINKDSE